MRSIMNLVESETPVAEDRFEGVRGSEASYIPTMIRYLTAIQDNTRLARGFPNALDDDTLSDAFGAAGGNPRLYGEFSDYCKSRGHQIVG